jgi:hypothetical protein
MSYTQDAISIDFRQNGFTTKLSMIFIGQIPRLELENDERTSLKYFGGVYHWKLVSLYQHFSPYQSYSNLHGL